jgi:ribonuclease J
VSRGFVEPNDYKDMLEKSRDLVAEFLDRGGERPADWNFIYNKVRDVLSKFYYEQTKRHPMILPFMVKV